LPLQHEGISEFDLFAVLDSRGLDIFSRQAFADKPSLFRAHFLLMHTLYQMRQGLQPSQRLDINPMRIRLWNSDEAEQTTDIDAVDHMGDYYLELQNLDDTTEEQIEEMIGRFWARFSGVQQRPQALSVLGLQDPVNDDEIKSRYRELAMEHHPDRGGDAERFAAIQGAMEILEKTNKK